MVPGTHGLTPGVTVADMLAAVAPGARDVAFVAEDLLSLASANIQFQDLERIAARLDALAQDGVEGAVIIQGTDSIEETAFAIELLSAPKIPVVFTGAMRGASQPGADGPANLAAAIEVARRGPGEAGVLVTLNDEVHAARYVRKAHTTALNAFSSGDAGPIGRIHEGRLRLYRDVPPSLGRHTPRGAAPWPKVAIQTVGLDPQSDLLDGLAGLGYAGCILEAMGAGHVPEMLVPSIAALTRHMPVALCSRTGAGRVCERTYGYGGSETDLLSRGVLSGGGVSSLKARVALALCLAAHGQDAVSAFLEIVERI
jgi:L-asparaginase